MPKGVICEYCHMELKRPRALRRHQCPAKLQAAAPERDTWVLAELSVATTSLSPSSSRASDSEDSGDSGPVPSDASPSSKLAQSTSASVLTTASTATSPVPTRTTATQSEFQWSPTRHLRRRLFEPHLRRLTLFPQLERFDSANSFYIDGRHARRHCDCRTCVAHALRLLDQPIQAEPPSIPGLRFVTLPGLSVPLSTKEQRHQLDEGLRKQPTKSLVACSCLSCVRHREFYKAWAAALAVVPFLPARPRSPREAGGCDATAGATKRSRHRS